MKTLKDKKIIAFLSLMVFAFTPFTAFATDMWAETPDLNNNDNVPIVGTGSSIFIHESPEVDMWAETPNLFTEREEHGVYIDTESLFVSDFNPAMYAETPDLNTTSAAPQVLRVESILIAKVGNFRAFYETINTKIVEICTQNTAL
jgi:hypothetical protein